MKANQPNLDINLQNVSLHRNDRQILRNITWSVPQGACAAVLGPNGSGKSTLARVIMGQMWPTKGHVQILGQNFGETNLNDLRESIRLVQSTSVVEFDPEETARGVVLTGFFGTVGLYHDVTAAMVKVATKLINQVGLKKETDQPFRTLSNGERMRCLLARALVVSPKLLILDEPTAGLDLLAREQILATIQKLVETTKNPPTILMITHHTEELLPKTSNILLLDNGRAAAAGKPAEVLTSAMLTKVYNFPVSVTRRSGRFWTSVHPKAWKTLG